MRIVNTETQTKFSKGVVHDANAEATRLSKDKSVTPQELNTAKGLLATLQHMKKPSASGEKGAMTKAINHLSAAIHDAKLAPGGGLPTHPLNPMPVHPAPTHPLNPMPPHPTTPAPAPTHPLNPMPTHNPQVFHPINPPIFKIRADDHTGGGGVIMKIRADDPIGVPDAKHHNVTSKRTGELGAAVHMLRTKDIKWTEGKLDDRVGIGYARIAIEDHRPTDGNAIFAYVPLGPPGPGGKADPNKVNTFFIQELPGRGGTPRFSQSFEMPKGIEAAPKIMAKAEAIGEKVAENNGHRLSRSDAVHLRDLKPLGNGKFEAKFDVSLWMDDSKVRGHITATVDANGKVLDKGTFKEGGAHEV